MLDFSILKAESVELLNIYSTLKKSKLAKIKAENDLDHLTKGTFNGEIEDFSIEIERLSEIIEEAEQEIKHCSEELLSGSNYLLHKYTFVLNDGYYMLSDCNTEVETTFTFDLEEPIGITSSNLVFDKDKFDASVSNLKEVNDMIIISAAVQVALDTVKDNINSIKTRITNPEIGFATNGNILCETDVVQISNLLEIDDALNKLTNFSSNILDYQLEFPTEMSEDLPF